MDNLIIESDSQIVINSILGKIKASSHISDLVSDTIPLAQYFTNISLVIVIEVLLEC